MKKEKLIHKKPFNNKPLKIEKLCSICNKPFNNLYKHINCVNINNNNRK